MDQSVSIKPYMAGFVFAVLVGFSFLSVKVCVPIASTIEILTFRYNFAFIGASFLVLFKFAKPEVKGKPSRAFLLSAALYIAFMVFQAAGLIFSTSIESAIIFAIIPIIAKMIAGILLKEKSTWKQNVFVYISVSALIFMIVKGAGDLSVNIFGIFLLAVSSICLAFSNVLMRYVREVYSPFSISYKIAAFGAIAFNIGYFAYMPAAGRSILTYFDPCVHPEFLMATAYLGILCILASAWLMSYMLANMEAVKATMFGNLSTAISIIAGVAVLREPLAFYNIVCAIMIVISVIGVSASRH